MKKKLFIISEELLKMCASVAIINNPPSPGEELSVPIIDELKTLVREDDWVHVIDCMTDKDGKMRPREIVEVMAGKLKSDNIMVFGNEMEYFDNELYRLVGDENVDNMDIVAYIMSNPRKDNIKFIDIWAQARR